MGFQFEDSPGRLYYGTNLTLHKQAYRGNGKSPALMKMAHEEQSMTN